MTTTSNQKLLLVDYENVHKIDLSVLDQSYRVIIFVGANQNPPKAAMRPATAHRFSRVDFLKIEGTGKNALDFHIAFELGRTIERAPQTECFVLSRDTGFDPLLTHLNKNGLKCQRITSMDMLALQQVDPPSDPGRVICRRCLKASTIEHCGGQWCTNCGCFASPPDVKQLPSNQEGFEQNQLQRGFQDRMGNDSMITAECGWCHQQVEMTGGIYDDGEWMCGYCVVRLAR